MVTTLVSICLVHGFHRSVKIRGSDVQGVKGEDRLNVDGVAKNLEFVLNVGG